MWADLVLKNGKMWTAEKKRPWAEAIAVTKETISFVGTNQEIESFIGPATRIINIEGRLCLPAFNDCHVHFHPDIVETALQFGITTIQDITLAKDITLYKNMLQNVPKKIRLCLRPPLNENDNMNSYQQLTSFSNGWIKVIGNKAYADGRISDGTALFFNPAGNHKKDTAYPIEESYDEMKQTVCQSLLDGFQPSIHAMGDKAIHRVLNLYQDIISSKKYDNMRFRMVHASVIEPSDIPRFGELNIIVEANPFQRFALPWLKGLIGSRARWAFPLRSLKDYGAVICFGSDHPGWDSENPFPLNPLLGIYAALLPFDKEGYNESLTIEEAISAYTINAAYACGDEHRLGSLRSGKLADIIVLSDNIFETNLDQIPDIKVLLTIIGGQVTVDKLN